MRPTRVTLTIGIAVALTAMCLWPILAMGAPKTNVAALEEMSRRFAERLESLRTPLYYELLASTDPAQRALNDNPDIALMYISENGMPVYYAVENINAARTVSTDKVWPGGGGGFSLDGTGTLLGDLAVWDAGGVLLTHQEFGGRVTQMDSPSSTHYHSTHVAGTMVAAGVNGNAKGMSYAAQLAAYDWGNDDGEMAAAGAAGLNVSNHSYGSITGWYWNGSNWYWYGNVGISTTEDYHFGFYSTASRDWDQIAYNAPYYLICKSAGNDRNDYGPGAGGSHYAWIGGAWVLSTDTRNRDCAPLGYDCIGDKGVSKNLLTVGAVDDLPGGWLNSAVPMSSFSGWGPTDDGRIKPDIVANGVSLYSTDDAHNTAYYTLSGTSMSSPNAAGSINLLVRYYESQHLGTSPLASTVKALVIETADECSTAGPDYRYGWGLLNTLKAAQLIQADNTTPGHLIEADLADQQRTLYTLTGDGVTPIRITLVWTDPAGTPVAAQLDPTNSMLVHDLDIKLLHSGGSFFEPYVLNPANPSLAAATGNNSIDNVEQVYISAPPAGDYFVAINHKGSLTVTQTYSLASSHPLTSWVCPITATGDVNNDGGLNSSDIIYMVNYVFKGQSAPLPCTASGDVNCNGTVTSSDILQMVNYVFKGGTPPCDVCPMIPNDWMCF